jgi:hypothetical protein
MSFSTEGMIDVTGIDMREFISACYEESRAQGMGHLHFRPGPIPDDVLEKILDSAQPGQAGEVMCMDYVLGRSVKMIVYRSEDGKLWVRKNWFDHDDLQLRRALNRAGLKEVRSEQG